MSANMGRTPSPSALLLVVALATTFAVAPVSAAFSPMSFFRQTATSLSSGFGGGEGEKRGRDPPGGGDESADDDKPPWFCHGIDCPQFKTLNHTKEYDTRAYPAGLKWTSTIVTGLEYDAGVSAGFRRLFAYISGANEAQVKVPMTAPVRVRVTPGAGPFCKSNFTVSFFVPFVKGEPGTQIDAPKPTDPEVFEETDLPALTVYARSFPGWADEKTLLAESQTLGAALHRDGKGGGGEKSSFFFAGYDSPFRVFGRHNEVWYVVDEKA